MFYKKGDFRKREIKIQGWVVMVLKETVLIWYEAEIALFQNINSKGMHYMIHKTGIKQIRTNNVYLKRFTKMNLSLTH